MPNIAPLAFQMAQRASDESYKQKLLEIQSGLQQNLENNRMALESKYRDQANQAAFENQRNLQELAYQHAINLNQQSNQMKANYEKELMDITEQAKVKTANDLNNAKIQKNKDIGKHLTDLADTEPDLNTRARMKQAGKFMQETGEDINLYKDIIPPKPTASDIKAQKDLMDAQQLSNFSQYLDKIPTENWNDPKVFSTAMTRMSGASIGARKEARQYITELAKATTPGLNEPNNVKDARGMYKTLLNVMLKQKTQMDIGGASQDDIDQMRANYIPDINRTAGIVNDYLTANKKKPELSTFEEIQGDYPGLFSKLYGSLTGTPAPKTFKETLPGQTISSNNSTQQLTNTKKSYADRKQELIDQGYTPEKIADTLHQELISGDIYGK